MGMERVEEGKNGERKVMREKWGGKGGRVKE